MAALPVSVIVVSQGRPALLRRCLLGIHQLAYRPVELIVVADRNGLDRIADLSFAGRIKTRLETRQNISAARNLGIAMARGEILAFVDDDAVPEPSWLTRLIAAFEDPDVMAAGGHVIGRNGISLQWGSRAVNGLAEEMALDLPGAGPVCPDLPEGYALKLQGTNFALRREAIEQIGGFDEAFAFYLDDTDLAMRLHRAGLRSAAVPGALVHHGFAPSSRRHRNRAPRSLAQIGASMAVYLRKHGQADRVVPRLNASRKQQRDRLDRFLLRGDLEPGDVGRLRKDLEDGIAAGMTRQPGQTLIPTVGGGTFLTLREEPAPQAVYMAGRWFQARRLLAEAAQKAGKGGTVTVFLFAPSLRAHRVAFSETGVWVQAGGLFGRSDRGQAFAQAWGFRGRVRDETERCRPHRG
ncbi:MAG: glycosyltransferase [Roseicyclus sp.]|nr:glycosyltransferase [Roseicyclus sp.]MBO6625692.1 glycosyltransferase [Roseicyclus sp.]MBO6920918.1 glycosyltransferase [Roseicyclus sp.]